jgi:hypothetical protein
LGRDVLRDLAKDYRAFGAAAISDFRKNEPRNYFRLLLSLVSEHAQTQQSSFDSLADEELHTLLQAARAALAQHRSAEDAPADT